MIKSEALHIELRSSETSQSSVKEDGDLYERIRHYSSSMQSVMDVYDMQKDLDIQPDMHRAGKYEILFALRDHDTPISYHLLKLLLTLISWKDYWIAIPN